VLGRRPDVIVLGNAPVAQEPRRFPRGAIRVYEQDVVADGRFLREYGLWHLPLGDGTLAQLFVRRDLLARLGGGE
jgi:hypothetical protein